jgi:hypothetical protein
MLFEIKDYQINEQFGHAIIVVSSIVFRIQSIQNVCPHGNIRGSLNVRLHSVHDVI